MIPQQRLQAGDLRLSSLRQMEAIFSGGAERPSGCTCHVECMLAQTRSLSSNGRALPVSAQCVTKHPKLRAVTQLPFIYILGVRNLEGYRVTTYLCSTMSGGLSQEDLKTGDGFMAGTTWRCLVFFIHQVASVGWDLSPGYQLERYMVASPCGLN